MCIFTYKFPTHLKIYENNDRNRLQLQVVPGRVSNIGLSCNKIQKVTLNIASCLDLDSTSYLVHTGIFCIHSWIQTFLYEIGLQKNEFCAKKLDGEDVPWKEWYWLECRLSKQRLIIQERIHYGIAGRVTNERKNPCHFQAQPGYATSWRLSGDWEAYL